MKQTKYILFLLIIFLGLFSNKLGAKNITNKENNHYVLCEEINIDKSEEKEWLCFLCPQEETDSKNQFSFFNFSSASLVYNFSEEICSKTVAQNFRTCFQMTKKSINHRGHGGWGNNIFYSNPGLINTWRKIDDELAETGENLRKSPEVTDEGLDAIDALEDAAQATGKSNPLPYEVLQNFKRGNRFNDKARDVYDYNEIVLGNKKRLDTYIPGERIISRKATDIARIQESTWRSYCNELVTKYKIGTPVNSTKLPGEPPLSGKYFIEIPETNKFAGNLEAFRKIAQDDYGSEDIIFLAE